MLHFAVTRLPGPEWDRTLPMRDQAGWDEHAAFMDGLAAEGFVELGGPLGEDAEAQLTEVLLIVRAAGEDEVRARLDEDPWVPAGLLVTRGVEPWLVVVGAVAVEVARRG